MKVISLEFVVIALLLAKISAQNRNAGFATDDELTALSEALYAADNSNANAHVTVNFEQPTPLFQIDQGLYAIPTVASLRILFNNIHSDASVNQFLDAVMATPVMTRAMQFLQEKRKITGIINDQRNTLKEIWFTRPTQRGRVMSSGFEHVFLVEIVGRDVKGLHNWIYFAQEEERGNAVCDRLRNPLVISPPNKAILEIGFTYKNIRKPVSGMFVGTPPELELALYTVCFFMCEDDDCPVSLNGHRFIIKTVRFRYRPNKFIVRTAFPII